MKVYNRALRRVNFSFVTLLLFILLILFYTSISVLNAYHQDWEELMVYNSSTDIITNINTEFNNSTDFFNTIENEWIEASIIGSSNIENRYTSFYIDGFSSTIVLYRNDGSNLTLTSQSLLILSDSFLEALNLDRNSIHLFVQFVNGNTSELIDTVNISHITHNRYYSENYTLDSDFIDYNSFSTFFENAFWLSPINTIVCSINTAKKILLQLGFYDDLYYPSISKSITAPIWIQDFFILNTQRYVSYTPNSFYTLSLKWLTQFESHVNLIFSNYLPFYGYSFQYHSPLITDVNTVITSHTPNVILSFALTIILLIIFSIFVKLYLASYYTQNKDAFLLLYSRGNSRKMIISSLIKVIALHLVSVLFLSICGLTVAFIYFDLIEWVYALITILIDFIIILFILGATYAMWVRDTSKTVLVDKIPQYPSSRKDVYLYRLYAYFILVIGLLLFVIFNQMAVFIAEINLYIPLLIVIYLIFSAYLIFNISRILSFVVNKIYLYLTRTTKSFTRLLTQFYHKTINDSRNIITLFFVFFLFYSSIFAFHDIAGKYVQDKVAYSSIYSYTIETTANNVPALQELFGGNNQNHTITYQIDFYDTGLKYSIFFIQSPLTYRNGIKKLSDFFFTYSNDEIFSMLNHSITYIIVSVNFARARLVDINDTIRLPEDLALNNSQPSLMTILDIARFLPLLSSVADENRWMALKFDPEVFTVPPSAKCYFSFENDSISVAEIKSLLLNKQIFYTEVFSYRFEKEMIYNKLDMLISTFQVFTELYFVFGFSFIISTNLKDSFSNLKYFIIRGYNRKKLRQKIVGWLILLFYTLIFLAIIFVFLTAIMIKFIIGPSLLYPIHIILSTQSFIRIIVESTLFMIINSLLFVKYIKNR